MTREQIEARIATVERLLAIESHPSTLATLNKCLERLMMMQAEDEPNN